MPTFIYQAKRTPTETVSGEMDAASPESAVHRLIDAGLSPVSVELKPPPTPHPSAGATALQARRAAAAEGVSRRLRSRDIDRFTRQLASLIKSNVPILRALSLIADQPGSPEMKEVVADLARQVSQGRQLSEALARYPRGFDPLYISLVIAGERGGALDEALLRLAEHREKELETRRRVQAALAYPAFVTVVGLGTVFAVLTLFLPRVIGLFENMKQELPLPTRALIGMTRFLRGNWYLIVLVLAVLVWVLSRHRPGSRLKALLDMAKLHIPLVRNLVAHAEIARFCRTLGLLIRNGISVHEGLTLATGTVDNAALQARIEQVGAEIVNKGATLSASLLRAGVFPVFAVNMIMVGEESGQLEGALLEVARVYDTEVEQALRVMLSLLEPVLILVIGGMVAFIVFAMLLPIFNIGGF